MGKRSSFFFSLESCHSPPGWHYSQIPQWKGVSRKKRTKFDRIACTLNFCKMLLGKKNCFNLSVHTYTTTFVAEKNNKKQQQKNTTFHPDSKAAKITSYFPEQETRCMISLLGLGNIWTQRRSWRPPSYSPVITPKANNTLEDPVNCALL